MRDAGLLDSAAQRPQADLFGVEVYRSLDRKAAVLLESLVGDHALVDGNKRLGWLSVVVLYGLNGVALAAPDDPAYELVIGVAEGRLPPDDVALVLATWQVGP